MAAFALSRGESRQVAVSLTQEIGSFLVYCPYGSHRPFETWIVPTTHRHRFEEVSPEEMADLARTLQETYRRMQAVRPGVPLELALHTAPNEAMQLRDDEWCSLREDYHWHIEVVPNDGRREMVGRLRCEPTSTGRS